MVIKHCCHCCHCGHEYNPKFASKEEAKSLGTPMEVEQWISGICSQKCWDELFPVEEE